MRAAAIKDSNDMAALHGTLGHVHTEELRTAEDQDVERARGRG